MNSSTDSPRYSLGSHLHFVLVHIWEWDKALLFYALLFALCTVLAPFTTIFLPKQIIDVLSAKPLTVPGVEAESMRNLLPLLRIIATAIVALLLANLGHLISKTMVRNKGNANRGRYSLLQDLKVMRIDYALCESPEGQLARRKASASTNDNDSGGEAIAQHGALFLAHALGLLLYSLLVASISPRIIAALAVGELIGIAALGWAQKYEAQQATQEADLEKKRYTVLARGSEFAYAKDIRLYNMGDWFAPLHLKLIVAVQQIRKQIQLRFFTAETLRGCIAFLRDFLAYTYLTGLVLQGSLTVGDYTLQFAAIAGISSWLHLLAGDIVKVNKACQQIGFLRAYLDLPDFADNEEGEDLPQGPLEIVFDKVSFRYPGSDKDILQNFSLTLHRGEKIALVGLNGTGKTTCVKLLTGLYRPDSGRILINGMDIQHFNRHELFSLFSVVFQESRTLATDVKQNVAVQLPDRIDLPRVQHSLEMAGLAERVNSLEKGLETQLTKLLYADGVEFSGGESQKLMLARALYKDAPIVVLDEPTAALDPIAEAELYQRYSELVGGKTSLYISHRLASTRFCDRIALISEGYVSELGNHEELMKLGGAYAHLFEVQSHYYQLATENQEVK